MRYIYQESAGGGNEDSKDEGEWTTQNDLTSKMRKHLYSECKQAMSCRRNIEDKSGTRKPSTSKDVPATPLAE